MSPYENFDEVDNADIEIAAGIAAQLMSSPQARPVMQSIFTSPNQVKMLAKFIVQLMGKVQAKSIEQDVMIKPSLWLADGGILDDLVDEFSDLAEIVGGQFDPAMMPELKQQVAQMAVAMKDNPEVQRQIGGVQSNLGGGNV